MRLHPEQPPLIRFRNSLVTLVALCALAGVAAPAAWALDGNPQHVLKECYDTDQLPFGKYTRHALQYARNHIPTDIREYSNCADLINAALASGGKAGGSGSGGAGGGYNPAPNPALTTASGAIASSQQDLNALNQATDPKRASQAPPQVAVAGAKLSPGTGGVINAAKQTDANSLPLPLILSLAALAAMAALAAATVLRRHWPQVRRAPLRLLGR